MKAFMGRLLLALLGFFVVFFFPSPSSLLLLLLLLSRRPFSPAPCKTLEECVPELPVLLPGGDRRISITAPLFSPAMVMTRVPIMFSESDEDG